MQFRTRANVRVQKWEDVYYALMGKWILYYDVKSGISGKLCGKNECDHTTMQCNAFINWQMPTLQIYDRHLYWIEGGTLCRMELNGENRETVRKISVPRNNFDPLFVIHRGYVYFGVSDTQVKEGTSSDHYTITRYELENAEKEGEILFEKDYNGSFVEWRLCGNTMYILVDDFVSNEGTAIYNREFYRYTAQKGLEELWNKKEDEWSLIDFSISEEGQLTCLEQRSTDNGRAIQYAVVDLEKKEKEDIVCFDIQEGATARLYEDYMIVYLNHRVDGERVTPYAIYDRENHLIREGEIRGFFVAPIGIDGENILWSASDFHEEGGTLFALLELPIQGNGAVQTLISCDVPMGQDL